MAERSTKASRCKSVPEPHVGIFWLLDGTLLTDSTPLGEAEPYGDHLTRIIHENENAGTQLCYKRLV
jgi:hypothetical protein